MSDVEKNTIAHLPFHIQAQYIKDLSFENPSPLDVMMDETEEQPVIELDVRVKAEPVGEHVFEVSLSVQANAKRNGKQMYLVELVYGAVVAHAPDLPEDMVPQIIMIYTPTLMFPFVRNILCDITRDGGYVPLIMAPVDFMDLFEKTSSLNATDKIAANA